MSARSTGIQLALSFLALAVIGSGCTEPEAEPAVGEAGPAEETRTEDHELAAKAVPILSFEPGSARLPYEAQAIGSSRCGACHVEHARRSRGSRMVRTGQRVSAETLAEWFSPESLAQPVDWPEDEETSAPHFRRVGDGVELVLESAGDAIRSARVDAVFGSGNLAFTPLSFGPGRSMRELRVSHFTGSGWRITPGSEGDPDALGYLRSAEFSEDCLRCHMTRIAWDGDRLDFEQSIFGITCERCHGPGSAHAEAAKSSAKPGAIFNPGRTSPAEQTQFCAQCHRQPSDVEPGRIFERQPGLARHAGASLMLSRCFLVSPPDATISCIDCHDPHANDDGSHEKHNALCARCHTDVDSDHTSVDVTVQRDCVSCHLPKESDPVFDLEFTSHWIRVPGAPPPGKTARRPEYAALLERAYREAIGVRRGSERQAKLRMRLGKLLFHEVDRERGLEVLRQALTFSPLYKDRLLAARYHASHQKIAAAETILEAAIAAEPEHNRAYHELFELVLGAGRLDAAKQVLDAWQRARPGDPYLAVDRRKLARREAAGRGSPAD